MHHFDIFHADRHLKNIDMRLSFDVRLVIPKTCKNEQERRRAFIIRF